MVPKEKIPCQMYEFSDENCLNGSLAKVGNIDINPYNFEACLPNQ